MSMQVALLAAGLGTRLRPLTHSVPKALVPVLNRPLLGLLLSQVRQAGARRVAVNTHHLAEQVRDFLEKQAPPGLEVIVRHEPEILGTGGGLRSLGTALGDGPFVAINADILTDLDIAGIYRRHDDRALATLVLHDRPPYNNVWLGDDQRITGIGARPADSSARPLAYTGIQVVSRRMVEMLPASGPADLVAAWRQALARGETLAAVVVSGHFWQDLGTPEAYLAAHRRLLSGVPAGLAGFFPRVTDPFLGEGTVMEEGALCAGGVCLGKEVRVGRGTRLENVVAWDRAWIGPGLDLNACVLGRGARVTASARQAVLV